MIETYGHQKLEQRLATAIAAGSRVEATQLQGELLCLGQVALPESISVWSARQVDTTAGSPQAHLGALFAGNRDFGFNQPRPSLSPSQSYQTGPNGEIIIDAWPLSPPQDFVRQAELHFGSPRAFNKALTLAAIRRVGAFSLAEAVVAWGTPDGDLLTAGPFNKEGSSTLMALLKGANYTEIPSEELPSPLRTGSNIDAYNAAWKTQRSE